MITPSVQRSSLYVQDPGGAPVSDSEKIYRVVPPAAKASILEVMQQPFLQNWVFDGKWIGARALTGEELAHKNWNAPEGSLILAYDTISFPSFPSEWSRGMLKQAALLELDLHIEALAHGYLLKDATPFNVLWQGNQGLHFDWLSLQKRPRGLFVWKAYHQFLRTFLYPLFASQYCKVSLKSIFVGNPEGLSDDSMWEMSSWLRKSSPLFFKYVTVPRMLKRYDNPSDRPSYDTFDSDERALWVMQRLATQLRNAVESIRIRSTESDWKPFQFSLAASDHDHLDKERWIERGLKTQVPKSILDIGCHTGELSEMALHAGSSVVAIDSDANVIEKLWNRNQKKTTALLPLVVDIAQPTPATGWLNQENEAFLVRCQGKFDCVWALSLIHRLLIQKKISLESLLEVLAHLTTNQLWIEYIDPTDEIFRAIDTAKGDWSFLRKGYFESTAERWFKIESIDRVGTTQRWLYRMKKI